MLASAAIFENNPSPALEMRETSTYTLQEQQGMKLVTACSFHLQEVQYYWDKAQYFSSITIKLVTITTTKQNNTTTIIIMVVIIIVIQNLYMELLPFLSSICSLYFVKTDLVGSLG